jgi:hypothetical protein
MPLAIDGNWIIERRAADLREEPRPQHFGNEFLARGGDGHFLGLGRFVPGPAADIEPTTLRQSPILESVLGRLYSTASPSTNSSRPFTGRL